MRRQIREEDIPESEIQEAQLDVFLTDAAGDLMAYLLSHITIEALGERLRYHKAVSERWAVTRVMDEYNQNEGNEV